MSLANQWARAKGALELFPHSREAKLGVERLIRSYMEGVQVTPALFGRHRVSVHDVLLWNETTTLQNFQYCIELFQAMDELGCSSDLVEWSQIQDWYNVDANTDLEWMEEVRRRILFFLQSLPEGRRRTVLCRVEQEENIPERPAGVPNRREDDRFQTGGQRANIGEPGGHLDVIVGTQNDGDQDVIIHEPWLGPPHCSALREPPLNNTHQSLIPFPEGPRWYPDALLELTVEDRFNLSDEVVIFDKEASLAQVPTSIPEPLRTAIQDRVRRMNVRVKPSGQSALREIAKAADTGSVSFIDIIAALCFLHFDVGQEGKHTFFRRQLQSLGALDLCDPQFPYDTNLDVQEGTIRDRTGQVMGRVTLRGPAHRRRQNRPRRLEDTWRSRGRA